MADKEYLSDDWKKELTLSSYKIANKLITCNLKAKRMSKSCNRLLVITAISWFFLAIYSELNVLLWITEPSLQILLILSVTTLVALTQLSKNHVGAKKETEFFRQKMMTRVEEKLFKNNIKHEMLKEKFIIHMSEKHGIDLYC